MFSSAWLHCAHAVLAFPQLHGLCGLLERAIFSDEFNAQTFLEGWQLEFRPKLTASSLASVLSGEPGAGDTGVKPPSKLITLFK